MNKKVYVVGGSTNYANWIIPMGFALADTLEESDLVLWTGGADLNPKLYNQKVGTYTGIDAMRDVYETEIYKESLLINEKILKIGICLGGQRLSVYNGASMVQHSRHPSRHLIKTFDGKELDATSSHHQQVIVDEKYTNLVEGRDYEMIGWTEKLSPFHLGENDNDYYFSNDYKEPEILFFPKTNSWHIQMHPEWMDLKSDTVNYLQNLIFNKE